MKKTALSIALLVSVGVTAQQDPQISQYMFSRLAYNAGYAGSSDAICGSLIYRNQWAGFEGAPKTPMLNIDATVRPLHGGIGLSVFSDKIGAEDVISAKISYAYRTNMGAKGKLGIGIESGIIQKKLDVSLLNPADLSDPKIPATSPSDIVPDLGFGLYYKTDDLYMGLSATHLLESELDYRSTNGTGTKLKLARHYYVTAGYNYKFTNPDLVLKPSILIKSDGVETQFDLSARLLYKDMLWGGVTYRLQDAVIPMVGVKWNNIKIGYAYDVTLSELNKFSSGSHEIMLGYCYPLSKKQVSQIYRNVLFL